MYLLDTIAGANVIRTVMPKDGAAAYKLDEMQKLVGGYIEPVRVPSDDRLMLVCNEEGLFKNLAPNPLASILAEAAIVGPALLAWRGDEGAIEPVPADYAPPIEVAS